MPATEIQELLDLRDWSRTDLASKLDVTARTVENWFQAGEAPGGPPSILLRQWLKEAREERERQPA